jgi:hypothetical protein
MLPTQVALVAHPDANVRFEEVLRVAAALQTQATRDLGPLWGTSAIVAPFHSLSDTAPGYIPVVIVREGSLGARPKGFHVLEGRQPISLIEERDDWSLIASHELLEILCDPWGYRIAPGRSLVPEQGEVEYLVEVCDPCQHSAYSINGVVVSDFVTPAFYGSPDAKHVRCSFLGDITSPLDPLPGGVVSWFSRVPEERAYLATRSDDGKLLIEQFEDDSQTLSREFVNSPSAQSRPYAGPDEAYAAGSERYGEAMEAYVDALLAQHTGPGLTLEKTIKVLTMLVMDTAFYEEVKDPNTRPAALDRLRDLGIDPDALKFPSKGFPSQREYETVLRLLTEFQVSQPGSRLDPPQLSSDQLMTAMHGYTG